MITAQKLESPGLQSEALANHQLPTTDSAHVQAGGKDLTLTATKTEARVDSRLLAAHLHNQHRPVMALIDKYGQNFAGLGKVLFQKAPVVGSRTGQIERFAMLNEDQAFFLLSLSRNTARVVDLKAKLVTAFREARRGAELRRVEYLPTYHALHDQIHVLASESCNERFVHLNLNKLINKAAGLEAGQRTTAALPQQSMLVVAQAVAARALQGARDHHDGYRRAKGALLALSAVTLLEAR